MRLLLDNWTTFVKRHKRKRTFCRQNPGEGRKPDLSPAWTRAGISPKRCGKLLVWHVEHFNSLFRRVFYRLRRENV